MSPTAIKAQCPYCSVSALGGKFLAFGPQNMKSCISPELWSWLWWERLAFKKGKTFQNETVSEFFPRFASALFLPVWGTASIWSWDQGHRTHGSVRCWSSASRTGICLLPWDLAWISISSSLRMLIHGWLLKFRCCTMTKYSLNGSNLCCTLCSSWQTAFGGRWTMRRMGWLGWSLGGSCKSYDKTRSKR